MAVVFDQVHFISQQVNVGVQELDEQRRPVEVAHVALVETLDLLPTLVLPVEKLFVGAWINLWTVKHLAMDEAEAFECDNDHGDLHLAYGYHECSGQLHIRNEHVDNITECELARSILVGLAVVVNPVVDAHLVLLLQARERQKVLLLLLHLAIRHKN